MNFTIFTDSAGQYRWNLKASNGRIVADSAESYLNKSDCQAGIRLVQSGAPSARITDETLSHSSYRG